MEPEGHAAFGKAAPKRTLAQQQLDSKKTGAKAQIATGGVLAAHGAASAPVLRVGRKKHTQMVAASHKQEEGRYQAELTQAVKEGKVNQHSTLRVLKTPSGRFINAGGTHRHLAREALGMESKNVSVANLAFEPRNSLYARRANSKRIKGLQQGAKQGAAGNFTPVSPHAREANKHIAAMSDLADDHAWAGYKANGGRTMASMAGKAHKAGLIGAGIIAGTGALTAAAGARKLHNLNQKKVSKAMDGHLAFGAISKRDFSTKQREKLAAKGDALPDGSFPIKNKSDLKNAERLESRSKHPAEVEAYIAEKKKELSKGLSGHDAFAEDISKAGLLGELGAAAKVPTMAGKVANMGRVAEDAGKGLMKRPSMGANLAGSGVGRMGRFARMNPAKVSTGLKIGAGVGGAGATGYELGKH